MDRDWLWKSLPLGASILLLGMMGCGGSSGNAPGIMGSQRVNVALTIGDVTQFLPATANTSIQIELIPRTGGSSRFSPEVSITDTDQRPSVNFANVVVGTYDVRCLTFIDGFLAFNILDPVPFQIQEGVNQKVVNCFVNAPGELAFGPATYSVVEGSSAIEITVVRTNGSDGDVSANFTTVAGTADAGLDFEATSGTLFFPSGVTQQTLSIPLLDDEVFEGDGETFSVILSDPSGGVRLGSATEAIVSITDQPAGSLALQRSSFTLAPGEDIEVVVVRSDGVEGQVTIDYSTEDGTAVAGVDYTAAGGTLVFAPGETRQSFRISSLVDPDGTQTEAEIRTFTINLSNPTGGAALGSPTAAEVSVEIPAVGSEPIEVECDETQVSGGQGVDTRIVELGESEGIFTLSYEFFTIPDRIEVFYEGSLLFADGPTGGGDTIQLTYSGTSTQITVVVTAPEVGTAWEYFVVCPASSLPPPDLEPIQLSVSPDLLEFSDPFVETLSFILSTSTPPVGGDLVLDLSVITSPDEAVSVSPNPVVFAEGEATSQTVFVTELTDGESFFGDISITRSPSTTALNAAEGDVDPVSVIVEASGIVELPEPILNIAGTWEYFAATDFAYSPGIGFFDAGVPFDEVLTITQDGSDVTLSEFFFAGDGPGDGQVDGDSLTAIIPLNVGVSAIGELTGTIADDGSSITGDIFFTDGIDGNSTVTIPFTLTRISP